MPSPISLFYLALTAGNLGLLGFCLGELRVLAPVIPIAALVAQRAKGSRVLAQLQARGRSPFGGVSGH
jgi:hypothetical protein